MHGLLLTFNVIVIVLFLVTLHEFGHFLIAKLSKMYVHEFAIGFGPKLLKWKIKETEYSLRLLPLGGYVLVAQKSARYFFPNLYGYKEINGDLVKTHESIIKNEQLYENSAIWKRISFISAGVIFNFLFAMFALAIALNIKNSETTSVYYPFWKNFWSENQAIFTSIGHMFSFNFSGLGSFVAIGKATGTLEIWSNSANFFFLVGSLSLSLAIFNLLPIAPMDGYKVVGLLYQVITKKEMPEKVNTYLNVIGLSLIVILFIGLLLKDIIN